ncbi:MAG: AAA family ATPase [Byssovorax sp.]
MYLREIHIENIRGFDEVHLDLDRGGGRYAGWTVIAGPNGTGKSTLLRAIALSVAGPWMTSKFVRSFAGWVREGSRVAKARMILKSGSKDAYQNLPAAGDTESEAVALRWEVQNGGPEPSVTADGMDVTTSAGPWAPNPDGWFIAGYGPFRRIGNREERNPAKAQMLAGLSTLFDEDATLGEGIQWLKHDVYGARLDRLERARKLEEKDSAVDTKALKAEADAFDRLHAIVLSLLNDGLLPNGAEVVDFNMEGLWVQQAGITLPLHQLSDGYRAVVALVFDILRQIHLCSHELSYKIYPTPVVVPYEGVILIDEIDAHLHIAWQKRIGFWLKEHFPNIQFIVTTHSPFICQAADAKGLIRLPVLGTDKKAEHVSDEDFRTIVNGGADDAALTALFGLDHAHSDASEEKRTRVAQLEATVIRGAASAEDQAELEQLLETLPDTGSAMVERVLRKHEALR